MLIFIYVILGLSILIWFIYFYLLVKYISMKNNIKMRLEKDGKDPNPEEFDYLFHKMGKYTKMKHFKYLREKELEKRRKRLEIITSIDKDLAIQFDKLESRLVELAYLAQFLFCISVFWLFIYYKYWIKI